MAKQSPALLAFNRGLVSALGLARVDQKRIAMAAETMVNWVARTLGSMSLRPGLQYLLATASNNAARYLDFVFSTTDTALIELTNLKMRIIIDDAVVSRSSVATAVTNGNFDSNLTGWTDADEAGATSDWVTGGYMGLTGNGTAAAIRRQLVSVASGDRNVEHGVRIVINRGPVMLRIGSTSGGDEYVGETMLETGTHSFAVTPTADFYIQFSSTLERIVYVDSCNIEAAGVMEITTPWTASDLDYIRHDQSGDVIFIACDGYQQRRIERRATRSWSVALYVTDDGPFRTENTGPITISSTDINGNVTLTASAALFRSSHVGTLFSITSDGQNVERTITAQNTFSDEIRIVGVDSARGFLIVISGLTGTGSTVVLQRSIDEPGSWSDVPSKSWTADTTESYDDGLDNQIVYYRIGVKTGGYAAGTIAVTLSTTQGSITGIVRITAYSSATSVSAEVLSPLGANAATDIWAEGAWSDYRGWPTSVRLHEGRLWWFGKDRICGSISDAFNSFDASFEGDAGPINRTIGSGPVDVINWGLSLQRLILGCEGAELSVRSSSLDEPLTPTNFNLKPASTQGSAPVSAVKVDQRGVYVQRNGINVYELNFDPNGYDYGSRDLTMIVPELGSPGIVRMAVQRKPDTRIHCVRSDGTVMLAIFDGVEDVLCWSEVETDGEIEDVVVLPGQNGSTEDRVYYVVARTVNGGTVRYLEKWAKETECRGSTLNKQADSFITFTNSPASATVTGLTHLIGESVVVWADGICLTDSSGNIATFTVSATGTITLTNSGSSYSATTGVVGVAYSGQWKSAKLGVFDPVRSNLTLEKRISVLGLIMAYVHAKGLRYGADFTNMDNLPEIESGATVSSSAVRETYDQQRLTFPGTWNTDSRLCLEANAPRPVTVLAAITDLEVA